MSASGGQGFLRRVDDFRRRYQGVQGLFWIRRVNHPVGALIALVVQPTRVTPNMVTVASLVVHLLAAGLLVTSSAPVSLFTWLMVMALWQVGFSLDCADGQLARARGSSSAFGAWLDQMVDVITHGLVYTALCLFVVRAVPLDSHAATLLTATVITLSMLQLFTTWGRNQLLGTDPATQHPTPLLVLLMHGKHFLDYGFYLFVAALLIPWPPVLLLFLVGYACLSGLAALAQLALNWRRYISDKRHVG